MQLRLHRVVLPRTDGLQEKGARRAAVRTLQRPAVLTRADDLAGIGARDVERQLSRDHRPEARRRD